MGRFVPSNQLLLRRGRIPGAVKMAGVWLLPKAADKPADKRRKQNKGGEKL